MSNPTGDALKAFGVRDTQNLSKKTLHDTVRSNRRAPVDSAVPYIDGRQLPLAPKRLNNRVHARAKA